MRMMTSAVLALGFIGAIAAGSSTATKAQGVSIYGPGVEVDIGRTRPGCGPYAYWNGYRCVSRYSGPRYDAYGYYPRYQRGACPNPTWTIQDGVCKPYRGY